MNRLERVKASEGRLLLGSSTLKLLKLLLWLMILAEGYCGGWEGESLIKRGYGYV